MDVIDWAKWHKLPAPVSGASAGAPRMTIGVTAKGKLTIGINNAALSQLRAKGVVKAQCDVFEGICERIGTLFVHVNGSGPYKLAEAFKGKAARITGIETDWAPEDAMKSESCRFNIIDGQGFEIDLPEWFDRELFREAERREG